MCTPLPSSTTSHLSLWTWMSSCLKSSPVSLAFVSSRFPLLFCLPVVWDASLILYFWNPYAIFSLVTSFHITVRVHTFLLAPPRILWSYTSVSQLVWLVVIFISYLLPNIILLFKLIYSFSWFLKMSQSILHSFLPFTSYPISHYTFPSYSFFVLSLFILHLPSPALCLNVLICLPPSPS